MLANDETEEVLGVSMVGNSAGEVIHEAAMAMHFHAKINDFIELLHVYPTAACLIFRLAIPASWPLRLCGESLSFSFRS